VAEEGRFTLSHLFIPICAEPEKKYAHLGVSELRRLRQLEEESSRLKRLVANLDVWMESTISSAHIRAAGVMVRMCRW
jgi:hypothetical protein